jgi:hypothetical protein
MAEENLATGAVSARHLGNRPAASSHVFGLPTLALRHVCPAWYTDLNQDNDVFRYAYVVDGVIYEGKASWSDADSNIYSHKPGDELKGVKYLLDKTVALQLRERSGVETAQSKNMDRL